MEPLAGSPDELDALFEDAIVVRDRDAVVRLFAQGAVLVAEGGREEVRGPHAIADSVAAAWGRDHTFIADPRRVVQARDLALVLAGHGISVMRRGDDRAWRYAISLLAFEPPPKGGPTATTVATHGVHGHRREEQ
jgi:ketosteroid isomerase-like protein